MTMETINFLLNDNMTYCHLYHCWFRTNRVKVLKSRPHQAFFHRTCIGKINRNYPVTREAMDFSENYTCSHGREIQLFNCNQCQITLYPMMLYYTKDDELRKEDYTAITDGLKHDACAVSELKGAGHYGISSISRDSYLFNIRTCL